MMEFRVSSARAEPHSASPAVTFGLRVEEPSRARIHAVALAVQIRIEAGRRSHSPEEQAALQGVFGEPSRWSRTLRPLLWTEVSRVVPAFTGSCEVELAVGCSYDLEVAASQYLHALRGGGVPLLFLFRGTVFTESAGGFSVSMLPWDREASFELPVATWRAAVDAFFPDQGWLRLHRDVLDSLLAFKAARAHASWDAVMRDLLSPRGGAS
jgi:hypothetical protein